MNFFLPENCDSEREGEIVRQRNRKREMKLWTKAKTMPALLIPK